MDEKHPLHIEGTEGATLFLGESVHRVRARTLMVTGVDAGGSRRLLFSLKQLQYIQYYIHEMGLVKSKLTETDNSWIPLPGAAHLMAANVFVEIVSGGY